MDLAGLTFYFLSFLLAITFFSSQQEKINLSQLDYLTIYDLPKINPSHYFLINRLSLQNVTQVMWLMIANFTVYIILLKWKHSKLHTIFFYSLNKIFITPGNERSSQILWLLVVSSQYSIYYFTNINSS